MRVKSEGDVGIIYLKFKRRYRSHREIAISQNCSPSDWLLFLEYFPLVWSKTNLTRMLVRTDIPSGIQCSTERSCFTIDNCRRISIQVR